MIEEELQRLPEEIRAKVRIENGEAVYVVEYAGRELRFPVDPEFIRQMESALRVMHKHREVLARLAKE